MLLNANAHISQPVVQFLEYTHEHNLKTVKYINRFVVQITNLIHILRKEKEKDKN